MERYNSDLDTTHLRADRSDPTRGTAERRTVLFLRLLTTRVDLSLLL